MGGKSDIMLTGHDRTNTMAHTEQDYCKKGSVTDEKIHKTVQERHSERQTWTQMQKKKIYPIKGNAPATFGNEWVKNCRQLLYRTSP